MDCSKTLYAVLTVHMLIGAVLPMEDYMLESSNFPVPDSTMTLEPSTLIVVPTSTSEAPPPNLQTSTAWMPTVSPTPEPVPPTDDEPFFNYLNQTLFLFIQSIRIEYNKYSYVVSGSELKSFELTTLMPTDLSLIATYNSSKGDKEFEVIFFFDKLSSGPDGKVEWHLDSFQHQNFSENGQPIYQYSGTTFAIKTLMGRGFNCSSIEFIGSTQGNDPYYARMKLTNLSLQPFLTNRQVSSDFDSCDTGIDSDSRFPIEVIVGVTVAICISVAAVIIAVLAIFIKKYQKRKDYDILSD